MSISVPLLRICHFESPFLPLQSYFCYNDERCCKEGCCSNYDYRYFESWYFWLGIILLFLFYRFVCWYCNRQEHHYIQQRSSPRVDDNSHIVNLMVSYNASNGSVPKDDLPPAYNVAIHLPKPITRHDQIPTYEQALSMN